MKAVSTFIFLCFTFVVASCSDSPQQADPHFRPQNKHKTFTPNDSPVVLVDEAHHNFLTADGRYTPFALVLRSDGFTVEPNTQRFSKSALKNADILVIANALDRERTDWQPPYANALNDNEVSAVTQWVRAGGALLLIADHTPFPRAIDNLARAFGFQFSNGHVRSANFRVSDKTLAEHRITTGDSTAPGNTSAPFYLNNLQTDSLALARVTRVRTFGGSAFKPPPQAQSLLRLGSDATSIEPKIPFQVTSATPRVDVEGWSQGAVLAFGKGRVAVFSEGMMFSSQLDTKTGNIHGMRSPGAEQNEQFLLNVMHWLSDDK